MATGADWITIPYDIYDTKKLIQPRAYTTSEAQIRLSSMHKRIFNLSKSNIRISKTVPVKGNKTQSNASQHTKQHHSPNYIRLHSPASLTSGLRIPPQSHTARHVMQQSLDPTASIPLPRFQICALTAPYKHLETHGSLTSEIRAPHTSTRFMS